MALYRECEYCGASLDPYEHCDCPGSEMERAKARFQITETHTADADIYKARLIYQRAAKAKK